MKEYRRDKRSPKPSSVLASKVMSSIKAKNTKPELTLRKILWKNDLRGYRLHWKKIEGRPDIVYVKKKVAIFINGCYWHRCPYCNLPNPKSNTEFWKEKFKKNIERDSIKRAALEDRGWTVLTFWECEIKSESDRLIRVVKNLLNVDKY